MNLEKKESGELEDSSETIEKSAYFDMCVDYALRGGWVKPEEKDIFIKEYLEPIYNKYVEIINEVKKEISAKNNSEVNIEAIIKKLGCILEKTQRIGTADPNNIIKSIYDYRDRFCRSEDYLEYAATSLAEYISNLLYSKS